MGVGTLMDTAAHRGRPRMGVSGWLAPPEDNIYLLKIVA